MIASDLTSTTRLVAHTLVTHGTVSGERIFPSVRTLAREASLTERAVCNHVDILVRRGFLLRQPRGGHTAGAKGFKYLLLTPSVLNHVQHSAERGSVSAERGSTSVLNDVQPSNP